MSLLLWDPFDNNYSSRRQLFPFGGGFNRRQQYLSPFDLMEHQIDRSMAMMDRLFDNDMNIQLRDHVGKLAMNEKGEFTYKVDASGFRPEELKVELQGNEIVLQGEHKEQNDGESVHRQFIRRVLIPDQIQRESIKCDLDNRGRLCVSGKSKIPEGQGQTRSIPIEMAKGKPAVEQQQKEGDQKME